MEESTHSKELAHGEHAHEEHASVRQYVIIAVILTVVTIIEVATYYMEDWLGATLVPILIVLTSAKFFLVVGYYMHLKFDDRIFRRTFLAPLTLSMLILLSLLFLFAYHSSPL